MKEDVHGTRLKFYHNPSLNTEGIMSLVVASETGMPVQCLMPLVNTSNSVMVMVRWRGLPESEDTVKPLEKVYEDVPLRLKNFLGCNSVRVDLVAKALRDLTIKEGERSDRASLDHLPVRYMPEN